MSAVSNPNLNVTRQDLADFYDKIFPYLGGRANAGFTPVGTVISVMGVTAPANYLACDGTVYNISDYPELARYFGQQFSMVNNFGGDGTTTFAVPDLRGEFLRGTGSNSHTASANGRTYTEGSGANVGVHQKATWMPDLTTNANSAGTGAAIRGLAFTDGKYYATTGQDSTLNKGTGDTIVVGAGGIVQSTSSNYIGGTVRPTNTSVLWCIATKNIYMNPSLDYSTDEKVVGSWVSGETLYQKTVEVTITDPVTNLYSIGQIEKTPAQLGISGTISVKYIEGVNDNGAPINRAWGTQFSNTDPKYCTSIYVQHVLFNDLAQSLIIQTNRTGNGKVYITLRYTKTT